MTREDRADTKRSLAHHASGDEYIVESCSLWDDDGACIGSRIIAAVGPLSRADLGVTGPLEPSAALFDAIDAAANLSDEDAAWLQAEEGAGRLSYPIGSR